MNYLNSFQVNSHLTITNMEYFTIGLLSLFVYFYLDSDVINFLYISLLTKTFSNSLSTVAPLKAFGIEVKNMFHFIYTFIYQYLLTEYHKFLKSKGTSSEYPIDLSTIDNEDETKNHENNDNKNVTLKKD